MPTFTATHYSFTPSAWSISSTPNWCLDSVGTGVFGKVTMIGWGGDGTTSTGYSTRWIRPTTAGTGAKTSVFVGWNQPNYTVPAFTCTASYGTSQPIVGVVGGAAASAELWAQNWNVQGGVGIIVHPLANPWWVATGVLQGALECQNVSGVDANLSSYSVSWEE